MSDLTAKEIARLREEIHAWRLDNQHAMHLLDRRIHAQELHRMQWEQERREWRHRLNGQLKDFNRRLKIFEDHKSRIAWLGWSLAIALFLGVFKLWLPALAALF